MLPSSAPFHTQVAVLDQYVHADHPEASLTVVNVITRVLRSREDLRRYFFSSGPSAGWARVLWSNGFFEAPPASAETDSTRAYPYWDAQEYLITVARDAPDIVLLHVQTVDGPPIYIARAVRALRQLPSQQVEEVLPRIVAWLKDPTIADAIAEECWGLLLGLAQDDRLPAAFAIVRALTAPVRAPGARQHDDVTAPIERVVSSHRLPGDIPTFADGLQMLRERDIGQVVALWEDALKEAEGLPEQSSSPAVSSWWRSTIEDTGHELREAYRDTALRALRRSLEEWVARDAAGAKTVVERYLRADYAILRRLALHLLGRVPAEYSALVASLLTDSESLDDVDARHEVLLLLKHGYPHLYPADQRRVIVAILDGPPADATTRLAEWAQHTYGEDPDAYARQHAALWVRDRLWMIHEHLTGRPAHVLETLVAEVGQPDRPELTHRAVGGWMQDTSPLTDGELSALSPDELVEFIHRWRPTPTQSFDLRQVSYVGLAHAIAHLVAADLDRYGQHLMPIARHRPEYAYAILEEIIQAAKTGVLAWDGGLAFCERLVADETVRRDTSRGANADWTAVRLSIVRLLTIGLEEATRAMPVAYLPKARDLLLSLVDDPDPDPHSDRPSEGWFGHGDPATVALNHVRPSALSALVLYASQAAKANGTTLEEVLGPGPRRLEQVVRETLTRKLDRREDPSQAVHSVYGRYLTPLYWLDQGWLEEHIESILPDGEDEQATQLYVAAWDSYVIFNDPYAPTLPLLRPKYERAILNLARGHVTKTHLEPEQKLANHVLALYLHSDDEVPDPDMQQSLIGLFLRQAPAEARGSLAWLAWRAYEDNVSDRTRNWPKIRALWAWRVRESIVAEHSVDYDPEIDWYARLLPIAAERETIADLWPLLEGMVPHIVRSPHHGIGRDAVEQYVRVEVERDPVRAIQLYRLMHEQESHSPWPYVSNVRREIIERAATDARSRRDALALIDALARRGDYQYQDIYDRHVG